MPPACRAAIWCHVNVSAADQAAALDLVDRIVAAFGMRDGVLYFQMFATHQGPRIVEIAPRLDGCHMWRLIRAQTGADKIAMAIDMLTGAGPVTPLAQAGTGAPYAKDMELMFQQTAPGAAFDPGAHPVPEGAVYHEYRYAPGEEIRPVNGLLEVVGYYVGTCT